ncbi:MAG: hypothetical protein M3P20_03035, partial [Thermoproteota archaeon]|nr:hypothetical protein [Thermoproteota archaeon]
TCTRLRTLSKQGLRAGVRRAKKTHSLIDHFLPGQKAETAVFVIESNIPKQLKKGTFSILYKNEYRFSTIG